MSYVILYLIGSVLICEYLCMLFTSGAVQEYDPELMTLVKESPTFYIAVTFLVCVLWPIYVILLIKATFNKLKG